MRHDTAGPDHRYSSHAGARPRLGPWDRALGPRTKLGQGMAASPILTVALSKVQPQDAPDASGVLTTVIQVGLVIGVATFGSVFLTQAALPGPHPTATAIAQTLWLIVAALVGCAIASSVMVRAQPAQARTAILPETEEVEIAGDVA
jgi:hypothetical protein